MQGMGNIEIKSESLACYRDYRNYCGYLVSHFRVLLYFWKFWSFLSYFASAFLYILYIVLSLVYKVAPRLSLNSRNILSGSSVWYAFIVDIVLKPVHTVISLILKFDRTHASVIVDPIVFRLYFS